MRSRPTKWIRFNPDSYRKAGQLQDVPTATRLKRLLQEIRTQPAQDFQLVYLYYNEDCNGELEICGHKDYDLLWHNKYVLCQ